MFFAVFACGGKEVNVSGSSVGGQVGGATTGAGRAGSVGGSGAARGGGAGSLGAGGASSAGGLSGASLIDGSAGGTESDASDDQAAGGHTGVDARADRTTFDAGPGEYGRPDAATFNWRCDVTSSGCLCSTVAFPVANNACPPSDCCFLFGEGSPPPCACNTVPSNLTCDAIRQALYGGDSIPSCPP